MYERYEPSDRIFVDREEHLKWMDEALTRCKEEGVVLHLKGIGGIGKSSLLDHWTNTIQTTIRVDCEQHSEFFVRLNILAKGAVLQGVNLQRFDVLWQIRQRFVEGVEPVREEGRQWAKEVFMAIPFIGTLTSIGSALHAIGSKVTPKLKGKFSTVGKWLEDRLGKNHVERLLEVLWKEPHHAEFLYLDALLEDINSRINIDTPLLFMIDHFEYVDNEKAKWRYGGKQITETELWCVFLCSLSKCVGVLASRKAAIAQMKDQVEESELLELDNESSNEFLRLRQISDTHLQDKIVSVSGGNPFVIGAICDFVDTGDISFEDIEDLGADTLEEVRIRTWRRLFNEAHDLTPFIDRAGLLPFFSRRVMNIIAPDMKAEQWDRLIRLSFVRNRGDETYVLHDLAEELVIAELSDRLPQLCEDVATRLEEVSKDESDLILLGLAISALARVSSLDATDKIEYEFLTQTATQASATFAEFLEMLEMIRIDSIGGRLEIQDWRGDCLFYLSRFAECEHVLSETLEAARELTAYEPEDHARLLTRILYHLAKFYGRLGRVQEAEEAYKEGISLFSDFYEKSMLQGVRPERFNIVMIWGMHWHYGLLLRSTNRLKKAEEMLQKAYDLSKELPESDVWWNRHSLGNMTLSTLTLVQISVGKPLDAELTCRKIVEAPTFQQLDPVSRSFILGNLCRALRKTNRPYDAEDALLKSQELDMVLYNKEPSVEWEPIVHDALALVKIMMQTGRYTDAERMVNEALDIAKEYAKEETPYTLAEAYEHLGVLFRETGRVSEAQEAHETSLKMFRTLEEKSPTLARFQVADSLNNSAILLQKTGKLKVAEKHYKEALEISKGLSKGSPEDVEAQNRVASVLSNYGILLRKMDKMSEAENIHNKALEIRSKLVEISPEMFEKHLAWSLNNLGVLLLETDRHQKSKECLRESLQLLRNLAEKTEFMFLPNIATVLNNLSILQRQSGDKEEAEKMSSEVARISETLLKKDSRVYKDRFTINEPMEIDEVLLDL